MLTVAYYFLQVCLCSAVMMSYYALVLRNKRFHQYNRFYLLSVAILPWLVPLVKIEINKTDTTEALPVQLFAVIADANTQFEQTIAAKGFQLTWAAAVILGYLIVSSIFLVGLLLALLKIYRLLQTNTCKPLDSMYLVLTKANGTPFSFFKFIFWNTDIDVTTHTGKQMLQHELTHVKEKHSADKLLLQIILIGGWLNPIFWLLKRELETIHEFIADNKTIKNGDTATLASMLLTAAYPQQKFALTNPFFYSPIKRRIAMLTNNKNPKFSYARRVVVLPLLLAITLLFAFRKKQDKPVILSVATALENMVGSLSTNNAVVDNFSTNYYHIALNKTYTVVIDAGHGGIDAGAIGIDGKSQEKDIALSIAKLIKQQNSNANINIILTRDNDSYMSPVEKVAVANKANPDVFLSVHCNYNDLAAASNKPLEGIKIFIANKQRAKNYDSNYQFAAALSNTLVEADKKDKGIVTRAKGIWVLQELICPSALVECGYMDNKAELEKLKTTSYQQKMATKILKGIGSYLANREKGINIQISDTVPSKKVVISDSFNMVTIKVRENILNGEKLRDTVLLKSKKLSTDSALYVVDGKNAKLEEVKNINPADIKSINILKGKSATDKYGVEGKNGVIEIFLKSIKNVLNSEKLGDTVLSKSKKLSTDSALYVIDGKNAKLEVFKNINPVDIKSINILKGKNAIDKYGAEGKNGVIEIELKIKAGDILNQQINSLIYNFLQPVKNGC